MSQLSASPSVTADTFPPAPAGWPTGFPWPPPPPPGRPPPPGGFSGSFPPDAPVPPGWPAGVPWPPVDPSRAAKSTDAAPTATQQPQIVVQQDSATQVANMGMILGVVIGILLALLVVGLCLWMRQRGRKRSASRTRRREQKTTRTRTRTNAMLSQISISDEGVVSVVDRAQTLKPTDAEFMVASVLAASSAAPVPKYEAREDASTRV